MTFWLLRDGNVIPIRGMQFRS